MWIGYTLYRQRGRQGVLYGPGRGRGVGTEDDGVRAWTRASLNSLKIITVADKPNFVYQVRNPLKCATESEIC